MELNAWSTDLTVEVGGHGVVSHAGSAVLRLLADNTGLTAALSKVLARRGFNPVHDRGRVLADLAVCIADGGRVVSDLAALREQGELFGPVASDPTLWRTLEGIGADQRERLATARARTRRLVWARIENRHGGIPPSRVADTDLGATVVIRLDATIQIAHSDKEQATGTFKGSYGHHPLTASCHNTGESLALLLRPGNVGSNTASDHIEVLGEAIAQIPARHRRNLLVTVDGAGATLDLICHLSGLNAAPGWRVHYSVGFDLDERARAAITKVPERVWEHVSDRDGGHCCVDGSRVGQGGLMRRRCVPAPLPRSGFAGFGFPPEVITVAVRWYLRYGLSYRDVEELLAERGLEVDHVRCIGGSSGSPRCSSTSPGPADTLRVIAGSSRRPT